MVSDPSSQPRAQWPYAAVPDAELETIRRLHINAEANVRALGTLLLLSGLLAGVSAGMAASLGGGGVETVIALVTAPAYMAAGLWLRRLDPRGRNLYTALVGVSLLWQLASGAWIELPAEVSRSMFVYSMLVGLAVNGLLLAILWSRRARVVFGAHYREVVRPATPHVRYRSKVVWLLLLGAIALLMIVSLALA